MLSTCSQVFEHYVGRALLPVSPRLTGRSARPTFFDSARKLVSGCLKHNLHDFFNGSLEEVRSNVKPIQYASASTAGQTLCSTFGGWCRAALVKQNRGRDNGR